MVLCSSEDFSLIPPKLFLPSVLETRVSLHVVEGGPRLKCLCFNWWLTACSCVLSFPKASTDPSHTHPNVSCTASTQAFTSTATQAHISTGESFSSMPGAVSTLPNITERVFTASSPAIYPVDSRSHFTLRFCEPDGVLWKAESNLDGRDYGRVCLFHR